MGAFLATVAAQANSRTVSAIAFVFALGGLVPQRAVQDLQGQQSVLTVGTDNTVQVRRVVTGNRVDERLIIEQGLESGDAVIVEGLQKVRPGLRVTPRSFSASAATTGR